MARAARRLALLGPCLGVALGAAAPVGADSWMAPQPRRIVSADGRGALLLIPTRGTQARFVLLQRGGGGADPAPPAEPEGDEATRPRRGERAVGEGACTMPMEAFCLDDGAGFVLFETYANLGHGTVAARYDGRGALLWTRRLADWFDAERIGGFRASVSSIWWYETVLLDAAAGELLVVYEEPSLVPPDAPVRGPNVGPRRKPAFLQVSLADGTARPGDPARLRGLLRHGDAEARRLAQDALARARPAGWLDALRDLLADEQASLLSRVLAAGHLRAAGDASGHDLVRRAASAGGDAEAQAAALEGLAAFDRAEALASLRAALRGTLSPAAGPAVHRALAALGADALPALLEMAGERGGTAASRTTAVRLLAQLGAAAKTALPVLARVAAGEDAALAAEARAAVAAIRAALR